MDTVVQRLLRERMAWLAFPELRELLPTLSEQYDAILATIPMVDLLAAKYEIHIKREEHPYGTVEPDDGIFLKYPERQDDPSAIRDGVPPDFKVYIQARERLEDLFKARGLWLPEFEPFFATLRKVREIIDAKVEDFLKSLARERPDLAHLRHTRARTVVRCMNYLGARENSDLAGKLHFDWNSITWHLFDNCEGLMIEGEAGGFELVPTRPGEAFLFVSRAFASLVGLEPVNHGAKHNEGRKIVVAFVYLEPEN